MKHVIASRDHFNGLYDRRCKWAALLAEDVGNEDYDTPMGRGATPLEAVEDLFWRLDLEDDAPYTLKILEEK